MRDLLKAMLKAGSGSLAAVLFGIGTTKFIAWHLGPEGLASFSLTRQLVLAGSALFLTGGQTAMVQGLASRHARDRAEFVSTCFVLLCGGSILVASLTAAAGILLGQTGVTQVVSGGAIALAGAGIALSGPLAFVCGALNAERKIGRLAIVQGLNAGTIMVLTWLLVRTSGPVTSARFALVLAAGCTPGILAGTVFLLRNRVVQRLSRVSISAGLLLLRFAFATSTAAALQAWTLLLLRNSILRTLGLEAAGIFDSGWSISMVYVMLILSSFSTYYLPVLTAAGRDSADVVNRVLRMTIFVVVPLIATVIVFRPFALVILYSPRFIVASDMMRWMLLGDFFKVLSFVFAMPMLARADLKPFLVGEIGWNTLMFAGTQLALASGCGLEVVGTVFMLSYFGYLLYALRYCVREFAWRLPADLRKVLITGMGVLIAVSVLNWSSDRANWFALVCSLGCVLLHFAFFLRTSLSTAGLPTVVQGEAKG